MLPTKASSRAPTRWPGPVLGVALFIQLPALAQGSDPPNLTRGPYLQSGAPSSLVIRWRTDRATDSRVQFGLAPASFTWEQRDAAPTNEHVLTLTNLTPDTQYFYTIGTGETNLAAGADCHFVTAPTNARPIRIWAIGDSGTAAQPGYAGKAARVRDAYDTYTAGRPTDVWLMLGDNAYLTGSDEEYQAALFDVYPARLRNTVLWPTLGNHDTYWDDGQTYLQVFSPPTQAEAGGIASGSPNYYSFNYGNIHFVCLDFELTPYEPGAPMITWLAADLAANTQDWLIAFWHRPPYSFGTHNSDIEPTMIDIREQVVPLLEAHGVDLVLGGHSHDYERSYLLDGHYGYSYQLTPTMVLDSGSGRLTDTGPYFKPGLGPTPHQGAVYAVVGSSGWVGANPGYPQHPAMFTRQWRLGSLVIDVQGNRLDAVFLRETGAVDDAFTIIKGAGPAPLRIVGFDARGGVVHVRWKSIAGQTYRVESATSLAPAAPWQAASPDLLASGTTSGWTNALPPGVTHVFFRVAQAAYP